MKLDNLFVSELEFEESGMRGPKGESGDAPSLNISKVAPYLYKAELKNYSYWDGETFVRENYPDENMSSCASVFTNGLFGHNYDGRYNNDAEFVVRTYARHGANGSLGVAVIPGILTGDMVDAETESELTKQACNVLPLFIVDGVNDKGVVVSMHNMPGADSGDASDDSGMCALFAVRYALDNANTAAEAVNVITNQTFWFPQNEKVKAGFYLLISDQNEAYRVDLNGNYQKYENGEMPILTNFRTIGWDGNPANVEVHANGLERYNILAEAFDNIEDEFDMMDALKSVRYTGVYDDSKQDFWYSDYNGDWSSIGFGDLTINSPHENYAGVTEYFSEKFENRQRDGETKQTVHTVVYNANDLSMRIMVQEENTVYTFCMDELQMIHKERERAEAAEQDIRDDFADTFYTKAEVDESMQALEEDITSSVSQQYYDKSDVDGALSNLHEQISRETDTKVNTKADAYENAGSAGQVLYKTETGAAWDDLPVQLPAVTPQDEDKILVVNENGEWVASDKFADFVRYVNIIINITSDNGGVPVGILTVTIRNDETGDILHQELYSGQPMTFRVPRGLAYRVQQSGTWEGYHNPTPAYVTGVATNDTSIVFTYEAIQVPNTLRELQLIIDNGGAAGLRNNIGLQFEDTYTENGVTYPIIWDLKDVIDVEDRDGHIRTGAVLEWHYVTPTAMPFDAPERLEVDLATEPVAQDGMYYYGLSQNTYRLLTLNAGEPLPTNYDSIFKNAVRNSDANIVRRGYSNYAESAVRKWLTSDQPAGSWWSATHVGDMPPDVADQIPGFLAGCSNQIKAMAKPVKIRFAVTSEEYDTVCDTFFIPSVDEVCGLSHNVREGVMWQDWVEATGITDPNNDPNPGRRVFGLSSSTAAPYVGLRTANVGYQYIVWDIRANGSLDGYANASVQRQYTPCCIVY